MESTSVFVVCNGLDKQSSFAMQSRSFHGELPFPLTKKNLSLSAFFHRKQERGTKVCSKAERKDALITSAFSE